MDEQTFIKGFHDESKVQKMTYSELGGTGMRLSKMSLGGGPFGGIYESLDTQSGIEIVKEAIISGINYIDTAPWYGQGKSEALLGMALKDIPRNAYYIGTKVGRYDIQPEKMFDFSAERILRGFDDSLRLLRLDYVDIIQVHDIEFAPSVDIIVNETLPALQKIVEQGKARFIGITGYPLSVLAEVIEKSSVKIDSVLSYTRNTLCDDELKKYIPRFEGMKVGVIDAAMLAMGMLTKGGPQLWHPATHQLKTMAHDAAIHCKENGYDISRLALQHSISLDGVCTFVAGAGSLEILRKNLKTVTEPATEKELQMIAQIKEKFFSEDITKNWEGVQVEEYWKSLKH